MSWEVLTMRSVTSFFNPALARSDLRRHWPILFLYTAIWMVALPVQLYLRHIAEGASYGTRTVSEVCQGTYSMGVIMAFVFGGVLAMALYSYLMNGRSVGLIHSLPLKRQTLFFTQLLTGFAMLTAGNLLVVLVSLLVCGEPGPLLVWLAVVTLAEIFFLALGTLCAMLTGWMVEHGFSGRSFVKGFIAMLAGNILCLIIGGAWLAVMMGFAKGMALGVTPFIAGAFTKSVLGAAVLLGISAGTSRKHN